MEEVEKHVLCKSDVPSIYSRRYVAAFAVFWSLVSIMMQFDPLMRFFHVGLLDGIIGWLFGSFAGVVAFARTRRALERGFGTGPIWARVLFPTPLSVDLIIVACFFASILPGMILWQINDAYWHLRPPWFGGMYAGFLFYPIIYSISYIRWYDRLPN
jgi:hypothetical protein